MKTKKDKRKASKARKLASQVYPTPKPSMAGNSNRTEAETKLERIKKAAKTKAAKRNPEGYTKGKFSVPIAGTTTNYDAFVLEQKAIPEKPNKTKFVRPRKVYKMYGRK